METFNQAFQEHPQQHPQWTGAQFAWDPAGLRAHPHQSGSQDSPSSSDPSEGRGDSSSRQRDQSLGPTPLGWSNGTQRFGGTREPKQQRIRGPMVCQVESCGHDLALEKGYYQRYRVCEAHLKLLSLMVDGRACRFCQQCGRFHELHEFDGTKRSCRARLQQHNARRRKRDPLDTKDRPPPPRRSVLALPLSDSSNDAAQGSGDLSHSAATSDRFHVASIESCGDQNNNNNNYKLPLSGRALGPNAHMSPGNSGGVGGWQPSAPAAAMSGGAGWPTGLTSAHLNAGVDLNSSGSLPAAGAFTSMLQQPESPPGPPATMQQPALPLYQQPVPHFEQRPQMQSQPQAQYGQQQQQYPQQHPQPQQQQHHVPSSQQQYQPERQQQLYDQQQQQHQQFQALLPPQQQLQSQPSISNDLSRTFSEVPDCSGALPFDDLVLDALLGDSMEAFDDPRVALSQFPDNGHSFTHKSQVAGGMHPNSVPCDPQPSPYSSMSGMQRGSMSGMHPGSMSGMHPGSMSGMHPGSMSGMHPGSMSGMQRGSMSGMQRGSMSGMQRGSMSGTQPLSMPIMQPVSGNGMHSNGMHNGMHSGIHSGRSDTTQMAYNNGAGTGDFTRSGGPMPWTSGNAASTDCGATGGASIMSSDSAWAPFESHGNLASGPGMPNSGVCSSHVTSQGGPAPPGNCTTSGNRNDASAFDTARRIAAEGGTSARYAQRSELLFRVSMKIANCTPDELPPDLYTRLQNLLMSSDASVIQGFLRPGCTHLVVDVLTNPSSDMPLDAAQLRSALGPLATRSDVLVQLEDEVSLWPAAAARPSQRTTVAELVASGSLPVIQHVSASAYVTEEGSAVLVVYGRNLAAVGVQLFARTQGGYLATSVQPLVVAGEVAPSATASPSLVAAAAAANRSRAALQRSGRSATDVLLVTVQDAPGTGLLLVEAQAGPLLSNWRPCLLSTDKAIAADLSACGSRALRAGGGAALASLEAFTTDLGRLLDMRSFAPSTSTAQRTATGGLYNDFDAASSSAVPGSMAGDAELLNDGPSHGLDDEEEDDGPADDDNKVDVTLDLVCVCERLLGWAADAGLASVCTFLVRALKHDYGQDMQSVLEAPYDDGLGVVHRCLRSGSAATVRALLGWAAEHKVQIGWGILGPNGLSPLHLAAVVPPTWRVLADMPRAKQLWAAVRARRDGATPLQLQRMLLASLPPGEMRRLSEAFATKAGVTEQAAASPSGTQRQQQQATAPRAVRAGGERALEQAATAIRPVATTTAPAPVVTPSIPSSAGAASTQLPTIFPRVVPFVAALALIAVAALSYAAEAEAPLIPALALVLALAYSLHTLRALSLMPSHRAFVASLGSRLLPYFSHPRLEYEYKEHRRASLAQLDIAGVSAVLLLCCASAHGMGGSHGANIVASINVCLTLLPLLLLQLSKPHYARFRSLILCGPYIALFNVCCTVSQASCGSPVLMYALSLAVAAFLLPLNTLAMLLIMSYTAMHGVRAGLRRGLGWPSAEAPSEACAAAQMAVVAAATVVVYAQDLANRQEWVVRAAAQRKQKTNKQG